MYNQRVERNIISNISKTDKTTLTDIYHVSEYCADIQQDMQRKELSTKPDSFYMKRQTEINENVRAILVDWLISVHVKFKLLPETLYITINLIDRYFSMFNVQKSQVQLVGIAALLIATKYEEIYPPTVKEFIYLTDDTFTRKEVLDMERRILFNIDFGITETTPYRFLERYSKHAKADSVIFFLA
jgi:G2/mitotic-specific cyclin-B, other